MSLIIAYIGKKGCVMASDKRKIAYFGDNANIKLLEKELYSGDIHDDDELYAKAAELDVSLKVSDDGIKLKTVGETVVGEVAEKSTTEVKRRRVYGTTNGYQIVDIIGSEIKSSQKGEKAIVLFGNKYTKAKAERLINQKWQSSQSLKYMGDIFTEVLQEISDNTPTVGKTFDVFIKQPKFNPKQAQEHLDEIITKDVKLLAKFRRKLEEDLIEQNRTIQLAYKIINDGDIGKVVEIDGNMIEVQLNSQTQAFDGNWKRLAKPNGRVVMFTDSANIKIGDQVVIENEKLCLKKDKSNLKCDIILCNL